MLPSFAMTSQVRSAAKNLSKSADVVRRLNPLGENFFLTKLYIAAFLRHSDIQHPEGRCGLRLVCEFCRKLPYEVKRHIDGLEIRRYLPAAED